MVQPSAAVVKDHRICVLSDESKVKSGREPASETVASVFHMELMLTPSAHMNTRKSNIRVPRAQVNASHRITSNRIASHRIVSYRIATAPGAIAESRPPFLPFTMFTYKVARRRKSFSNSVSLFVWSPVGSPVQGHRRLGAFQSQQYLLSALSDWPG